MMLVSLLLILLQVCSQLMTAVAIPTCLLNGHVVQSAHHMLRDLGGSFPVSCLPVNINISFPSSALPAAASANPLQCRKALWVVYESLQEAGLVFEEDLPAGLTWRDEKLQRFRHLQFRLMEEGQCLSGVDGSVVLSSYFSNVTAVLEQQGSAVCGWEALRRDLLWVLKSALHQHHNCFTWGTKTPPTSG
ncbi:interferon alpha-H-like [Gymnodraco acuticeps]|uniref:Interferon alpha-H-like n=2 Tax=Notothenioidei TaxID=8205 RepID=A0A6P8TC89_GYMAC|nr:interferon alpha-H-like [Gymnodraco acuticeps]